MSNSKFYSPFDMYLQGKSPYIMKHTYSYNAGIHSLNFRIYRNGISVHTLSLLMKDMGENVDNSILYYTHNFDRISIPFKKYISTIVDDKMVEEIYAVINDKVKPKILYQEPLISTHFTDHSYEYRLTMKRYINGYLFQRMYNNNLKEDDEWFVTPDYKCNYKNNVYTGDEMALLLSKRIISEMIELVEMTRM